MASSRLFLCLALSLLSVGYSGDAAEDKTTEAVVKAVVQAENKPEAQQAEDQKDAKKSEEASAVAEAAKVVLDKEGHVDEMVAPEVLDIAAAKAKETFKEMKDGGVGTKAAAGAAAEVAVATVDGATGLGLTEGTKDNAEKAAVAAGKAVDDHPNDQAGALAEAVSSVKEEESTGKVDLKHKAKGVVESATAAVSNLPHLAEGAVHKGAQSVENMDSGSAAIGAFAIVGFGVGLFVIGRKHYAEHFEASPYMKRLQLIREEFNGANGDTPDLETQYNGFDGEMRALS